MNQTVSVSSPTEAKAWFQKDSDVKAFIDLVNYQGFILEDAVFEAVSGFVQAVEIHQREVFDGLTRRGGERVEIDLWIKRGNFIFDLESKRSDFDWVFLQNSGYKNDVHLMSGPDKEVFVMNHVFQKITCVANQVIEVSEDPDTLELRKTKNGNKNQPTSCLPIRSKRDDYVHNGVRQALFNTEVLIQSHSRDRSWVGTPHRIFIPVIVTNTRLIQAIYSSEDINNQACLTNLKRLTTVPFAAINHAEILYQGQGFKQKSIDHIGRPPTYSSLDIADERFKGTHEKTVFVVNQSHLHEFISTVVSPSGKTRQKHCVESSP